MMRGTRRPNVGHREHGRSSFSFCCGNSVSDSGRGPTGPSYTIRLTPLSVVPNELCSEGPRDGVTRLHPEVPPGEEAFGTTARKRFSIFERTRRTHSVGYQV